MDGGAEAYGAAEQACPVPHSQSIFQAGTLLSTSMGSAGLRRGQRRDMSVVTQVRWNKMWLLLRELHKTVKQSTMQVLPGESNVYWAFL